MTELAASLMMLLVFANASLGTMVDRYRCVNYLSIIGI